MSTDLYFMPMVSNKTKLPRALKYIISKKFWGHDGSLAGDSIILCDSNIDYLNGILDTTDNVEVRDAIRLILKSIEQYGMIEMWLV